MGYKMKGYQAHDNSPLHSEGRWSRFKNWVSDKMPQTDQFPQGSKWNPTPESFAADKKKAYEEAVERDARRRSKFDKHEKFRQTKEDYEPRNYETYIQDFGGGTDLDIIKGYEDEQAAEKTKGNQQGMISADENAMLQE